MTTPAGYYLSVPVPGDVNPIVNYLADATTMEEARMDAELAGMESFVLAGYDDDETAYATLYQLAPNGGLVSSECFPISGPEAG